MKSNTLINPNFPTIPGTSVMPGISALVRILAKANGLLSTPLRYGNRAQAEKKRESLADCLTREDLSSAVVQVESRFLVAVFPAGYDFDQKSGRLIERLEVRPSAGVSRRPPFATVSGPRINPRNRHNQNGAGPVYCGEPLSSSGEFKRPKKIGKWAEIMAMLGPRYRPMNRREQYRAVSDRLNGRG